MDLALLALTLLGHAAIWVAVVNRTHSFGWPHRFVFVLTALEFVVLSVPPGLLAVQAVRGGAAVLVEPWVMAGLRGGPFVLRAYLVLCWFAAAAVVARWLVWRALHRPPRMVRLHRTRSLPVRAAAIHSAEHPHHFLVRVPGNQALQLDLTERAIDLPGLPAALDGLSIVHLSDFHFTGHLGKPYYQEIVRHANELEPDLVAVTGDIVDRSSCIDWLPDTLGHLHARYGVYFVLGNHDARVDVRRLLRVLDATGLVHVGGRWIERAIRGQRVVLAGNERPWLGPRTDLGDCPPRPGGPLRVFLTHSPDQLAWARDGQADLLLAGHTHGGQVRLPWIGPIFSPSRDGILYASGVFYAEPTIMHVTRGISGELPVRVNCPPEMALLRLHAVTEKIT